MPAPKKKRLTKKQAKLVRAIVDPNVSTASEAGKIAGYNCRQDAHKALQSPTVQSALEIFLHTLEAKGVTDDLMAERIREGMDATQTKFFAHEGEVIDERTTVDYNARHKYIETVAKIRQYVRGGSEEPPQDSRRQLIIVLGTNGHNPLDDII